MATKIKKTSIKNDKKAIAEVFDRFAKTMPEAATELHFTNPYTLLVAVALSAQATDVGVNKATKSLFEKGINASGYVEFGAGRINQSYQIHRPL